MSADTGRAAPNPWVIAVVVSVATFMEVLDTTIANVSLRYIAGTLAISNDQASWVVTSYLVANAIVLTASSFLARALGRKRFYIVCVLLFTAASVACGLAWNIESLLLFRVLQGLGGGGLIALSQATVADVAPGPERGKYQAYFSGVFAFAVQICVGFTVDLRFFAFPTYFIFLLMGAVVLVGVFYGLVWALAGGETLGRQKTGLRIVNLDGLPVDWRQRLGRLACATVSVFAVGVGLVWSIFDEESLAWHDHMSRSFPTAGD